MEEEIGDMALFWPMSPRDLPIHSPTLVYKHMTSTAIYVPMYVLGDLTQLFILARQTLMTKLLLQPQEYIFLSFLIVSIGSGY